MKKVWVVLFSLLIACDDSSGNKEKETERITVKIENISTSKVGLKWGEF